MVENIVVVLLVILAVGAGVWVWRMEVGGTPIVPPGSSNQPDCTKKDNQTTADSEESA